MAAADRIAEKDLWGSLRRADWAGFREALASWGERMAAAVERHRRGEETVDAYGMDLDYLAAAEPFLDFLYQVWWRVEVRGIENVPLGGRTLLVCNHSGVLPFDQLMLMTAIRREHPNPRPVRGLHLKWLSSVPFVGPLTARSGQVQGLPANAERLFEEDQLVSVFPEGIKGIGKLFRDRYRLARFGRGGYVKAAMKTCTPIVPVAIVGAEETYPALTRVDRVGKLLGIPYLPITPTFPLLGPLGFIALPTKWTIEFLKPVRFQPSAADHAGDYTLVHSVNQLVRSSMQECLARNASSRRSLWY